MSIISEKNTFLAVGEIVHQEPLFRFKSMPIMHIVDCQAKPEYDRLSDSTRCPSEAEEPVQRKDKMSRYCKKKLASHRTTCMIRNVPCKLTQEELMQEIATVSDSFNFLYLPNANKAVGNLGYAFVNFTTNAECEKFLKNFEGHTFTSAPRSKKQATVTHATLQGFKENVKFFARSRVGKSQKGPWIAEK